MKLRFTKMHGLGNDFVVVDASAERIEADPAARARRICDRHEGVGADGLILIVPPERGVAADLRMRIWNADGSEPEMCGNGIRCVCKLAHDRGLCRKNPMRIQTGRGVLDLAYTLDRNGDVESVQVSMGEPVLDAERIPVLLGGHSRVVDVDVGQFRWWEQVAVGAWQKECGLEGGMTCVSMGNPHAVFFCRDVEAVPLGWVGPILENHPIFPNRVNVHFVQVLSKTGIRIRTWERGAGMTRACGTGASAACVAGVLTCRTARRVRAQLPGGELDLDWRESDGQVWMTGPAATVFAGEWPG
jgi:diaminopimelate epimerase